MGSLRGDIHGYDETWGKGAGSVYIIFLGIDEAISYQKIPAESVDQVLLDVPVGNFGRSVASLGDLDGDAVPDVAVGADQDNDEQGGHLSVAVFVFFLHASGGLKFLQKIGGSKVVQQMLLSVLNTQLQMEHAFLLIRGVVQALLVR